PLLVTVHLSPEDPRYIDLRRNVLSKLERAMPDVAIQIANGLAGPRLTGNDYHYGEVTYQYGAQSDASRSTSHREVLPLIYRLAGVPPPAPLGVPDYPGYPLVTNAGLALAWFFGGLPLLILVCWWWSRRPPSTRKLFTMEEIHEHP